MLPAWLLKDRFWLVLAGLILVVAWSIPVVSMALYAESHIYFALGYAMVWSVIMAGLGFAFYRAALKNPQTATLLLVLAVGTLTLLYRVPDNFVQPQFWAEDAVVFFKQQHESGWQAVGLTYAGYYHTTIRLFCQLIASAPLLFVPAFYNLAWLAVYSIVTTYILFQYPDKKWSPLVALVPAWVAHNGEVFLSLTNVIWVTGLALTAMVLLPVPQLKKISRYALSVVLLIFALTGPFSLILSPFYILRWLADRKGFPLIYVVVIVAGALVQLWGLHAFYAEKPPALPWTFSTLALCLQIAAMRVPWSLVVGYYPYDPYWIIGLVVSLGLVAFMLWEIKSDLRKHLFPIGCLILCGAYVALDILRVSPPTLLLSMGAGDRYFYIPKILFVWSLIHFVSHARNGRPFQLALLLCVLGSLVEFTDRKSNVDDHWPHYVDAIAHGDPVIVPINPGWTVGLNFKDIPTPSK